MNQPDGSALLAEYFEEHRAHLRSVAYRMLGSLSEADDAVQEAWLRLSRADPGSIENLRGWLTTVVARVCLNMLRARRSRREESLDAHLPRADCGPGGRSRSRIGGVTGRFGVSMPEADLGRQRQIVDAFLAVAGHSNFDALLVLLDPDVVLRADFGPAQPGLSRVARGARIVAAGALRFARLAEFARPVVVNGSAGILSLTPDGRPYAVLGFTIRDGRIIAIDILGDPARLKVLDLRVTDRADGG